MEYPVAMFLLASYESVSFERKKLLLLLLFFVYQAVLVGMNVKIIWAKFSFQQFSFPKTLYCTEREAHQGL